MMTALTLLTAFLLMLLSLSWSRSWLYTSLLGLAVLCIGHLIDTISISLLLYISTPILVLIVLFGITPLRRHLIIHPLFRMTKRRIKPLSETEQVALSTGDTWVETPIFRGELDLEKLWQIQPGALTHAEQAFIDQETTALCALLNDWDIVHTHRDLPPAVWDYLKQHGFFGLVISPEYGGKGFSAAAHAAVVKKIATKSITAAITVMVPNSLGPGELISHYGTSQQKQELLPKLATGSAIPCFALTGTYAGSDATAMTDTGTVIQQADGTLAIRLTFAKRYITLAPVATIIGLAFQLSDPEQLLQGQGKPGITLCLIPHDHPGVEIGDRHNPMGVPFMNGPICGTDVVIPIDWIIGGQAQAGAGWKMLISCLAIGRAISLPAVCDAYNNHSVLLTSAYVALREQFHAPLIQFEGISQALGNMVGLTYTTHAMRMLTLIAVDQQHKPAVASAIAKYHATEMSRMIINHAMDIHGGKAIMLGVHNPLATVYQALPISITVEGANILTRHLIIFGQGAMLAHPTIYKTLLSLQNEGPQALADFDAALCEHIHYSSRNWAKHTIQALTAGKLAPHPGGPLAWHYQQVYRMSVHFAALADTVLIHLGSSLKRHECVSARLGDIMSHLYMATAALHCQRTHSDIAALEPITAWAVNRSLYMAQEALITLCENYPCPVLGKLLRLKLLPWGRPYRAPSDNDTAAIARAITHDAALRAWFARDTTYGNASDEGTQCLEAAYNMLQDIQPQLRHLHQLEKQGKIGHSAKLHDRIEAAYRGKYIAAHDYRALIAFATMLDSVLAVDQFPTKSST